MKKTDIREGVTYQTKTGNASRLVLEITDDWTKAKAAYPYLQEDAPSPYAIFKQMRGQHIGSISALTLNSFAAWAHSSAATAVGNAADLGKRVDELTAALIQCRDELRSIHMQHGDEDHALTMSAGLRAAREVLKEEAAK